MTNDRDDDIRTLVNAIMNAIHACADKRGAYFKASTITTALLVAITNLLSGAPSKEQREKALKYIRDTLPSVAEWAEKLGRVLPAGDRVQ
jgi:hypothetical protein